MQELQRKPESIGSILRSTLQRSHLRRALWQEELFKEWNRIVGPSVAKKAQPISLKGKALTVKVSDSAWRYQLSLMKPHLKEEINKAMGGEFLKEIFLIYGEIDPSPESPPPSFPKAAPLSEAEKRSIQAIVEETKDPELKQILQSIIEKSFKILSPSSSPSQGRGTKNATDLPTPGMRIRRDRSGE